MEEFKFMTIFVVLLVGFLVAMECISILDMLILGNEETIEGVVIDSEYSQSGFGSNDITVLYFDNGKTIIFTETIEIDRNRPLRITYKDYLFLKGKGFVSVEYL